MKNKVVNIEDVKKRKLNLSKDDQTKVDYQPSKTEYTDAEYHIKLKQIGTKPMKASERLNWVESASDDFKKLTFEDFWFDKMQMDRDEMNYKLAYLHEIANDVQEDE
jgi:hypothetical protein